MQCILGELLRQKATEGCPKQVNLKKQAVQSNCINKQKMMQTNYYNKNITLILLIYLNTSSKD